MPVSSMAICVVCVIYPQSSVFPIPLPPANNYSQAPYQVQSPSYCVQYAI